MYAQTSYELVKAIQEERLATAHRRRDVSTALPRRPQSDALTMATRAGTTFGEITERVIDRVTARHQRPTTS